MADKKTPQVASNIFHSIMKASVKPVRLTDNEIIEAVKIRFDKKIERKGNEFILVDNDFSPQHSLVKEINVYIVHIKTHGI